MANMNFGDSMETLANDDFWIDVAMLFAGYFGAELATIAFESVGPDLPNELYGIGVAAGATTFTEYRMIAAGGGLYTADVLASRFNVKASISEMAA